MARSLSRAEIGPPNPTCFIIAEAGNCHEGNLRAAYELIEAAREVGADAVKFQAGHAEGFARNPTDPTQIEFYKKYDLGASGYDKLITKSADVGIPILFSVWSDDYKKYMLLPWRKIAARQCVPSLVKRWDMTGTFVSIPHTMVGEMVQELWDGIKNAVPMHCVSLYPSPDPLIDRAITLQKLLKLSVGSIGYSDHTLGVDGCVKMALHEMVRACVIEKHFTLAHDYGPLRDHLHAATPDEFRYMIWKIKRDV